MGIIQLPEEGFYDIKPILAPKEVRQEVINLLERWEEWRVRMTSRETGDAFSYGKGIGEGIQICIVELSMLFGCFQEVKQ